MLSPQLRHQWWWPASALPFILPPTRLIYRPCDVPNPLGEEVVSWISWGFLCHERGSCHRTCAVLRMHNYPFSSKISMLALFKIKVIIFKHVSETFLLLQQLSSKPPAKLTPWLDWEQDPAWNLLESWLIVLFWKTEENCLWSTFFSST